MKKSIKILITSIVVTIICFSCTACVLFDSLTPRYPNIDAVVQKVEINGTEATADRQKMDLPDAIDKVSRSVVAIEISANGQAGAGAGVIVDISLTEAPNDPDVIYVVTCNHVIGVLDANVTVYIPDEQGKYDNMQYIFTGVIGGNITQNNSLHAVTLVGADLESDLAVLKIDLSKGSINGRTLEADKICKAVIAPDTYSVRKGESVFAIGNPTGALPGWTCAGIVSTLEVETAVESVGTMRLMGIDASTNQGNSGGGLFNLYGELIGITNAGSLEYTDINFAIPLETSAAQDSTLVETGVKHVVKSLVGTYYNEEGKPYSTYGYVPGRKAKMGITVEDNDSLNCIRVREVLDDSAAKAAGFKNNDLIRSLYIERYDGGKTFSKEIDSLDTFRVVMAEAQVGDIIHFSVTRSDNLSEIITISVKVMQYCFGSTIGSN